MEAQAAAWLDLLCGTNPLEISPIPQNIQLDIASAMQVKLISAKVRLELTEAINSLFTFQEFEHCQMSQKVR